MIRAESSYDTGFISDDLHSDEGINRVDCFETGAKKPLVADFG